MIYPPGLFDRVAASGLRRGAGVGRLGIVDHDTVDRSNLQRQVLHTDAAVGTSKVESARRTLHALNPKVRIDAWEERLSSNNVERIFDGVVLAAFLGIAVAAPGSPLAAPPNTARR